MTDFAPFRGVRYAPNVPPESGISPPYDAIDEKLHQDLLDHHPRNSVRWTLGENPAEPTAGLDEYRQRGELVRSWLSDGILVRDEKPAFYRYSLEYTGADGSTLSYHGLMGAIEAGPWGELGVYPHEETKPHVVKDRLALLEASAVDMGVVHLIVRDPDGELPRRVAEVSAELLFDGIDHQGARHRVERIDDPETVAALQKTLEPLSMIIADGHHRYTTFMESRRRGDLAAANRVLATVADLDQPGLVIRPTHRLLVWPEHDATAVAALVGSIQQAMDDGEGEEWQLHHADGTTTTLRTVRDPEQPTLARRLANVVGECADPPAIENWANLAGGLERLRELPTSGLYCELPAVTKDEFWDRARAGEIFPPKTTWFEPKCPSGILARLLGDDA